MSEAGETLERGVGVFVPSSNRTVERTTERILADIPTVGACYGRITYHGDISGGGAPEGYDHDDYGRAADMLAHAKVEILCWNGTKGSALGFEADRTLVEMLNRRTGLPAITTALATLDLLSRADAKEIALLLPGTEEATKTMADGFRDQGIEVVATRSLGVRDNFACAQVEPSTYRRLAHEVFQEASPRAVLTWNTNARGLAAMGAFEGEEQPLVMDSAAIGVFALLDAMGIDKAPARRTCPWRRGGQGRAGWASAARGARR